VTEVDVADESVAFEDFEVAVTEDSSIERASTRGGGDGAVGGKERFERIRRRGVESRRSGSHLSKSRGWRA
jgi:hypothetical protein